MNNHRNAWEQIRQRERIRLFRLAQGKRPWHAHVITQGIIALLGLGFVVIGVLLDLHGVAVIKQALPLTFARVESMPLGAPSTLGGVILLVETLLVLPRRLRQVPSHSAACLRDQLLREAHSFQEQQEE